MLPSFKNKNGNLTTPKDVKVDNAGHADDSDRAINYFGKKYTKLDWMTSIDWQDANREWGDEGSLLLSGESINMEDSNKDVVYLEVLPSNMSYTYKESETGHNALVNLGNPTRHFGKIYADSFNGKATEAMAVSIQEGSVYNKYELSITGNTLTLTKK